MIMESHVFHPVSSQDNLLRLKWETRFGVNGKACQFKVIDAELVQNMKLETAV